uniref:Uncharacterized protein n=1 Tax=Strigamia maritima TaxID=126957 RepID=T1IX01_STRMM
MRLLAHQTATKTKVTGPYIWKNNSLMPKFTKSLNSNEMFNDSLTIKSCENKILALDIKVTTFEEDENDKADRDIAKASAVARSAAIGAPGAIASPGRRPNTYLPKLPLANFQGDLLQWPSFIDMFEAAINSNVNLTNVEKMQYLKSACSGPAAKVIEWFPIEEKNYQIALDALKEHFGATDMIESALVKVIKICLL